MRVVLFCENRYAVDILEPIQEEMNRRCAPGDEALWYVHKKKIPDFPLAYKVRWTNSIKDVMEFNPEAIFVPGNIVPYYLPGVKIQVFHGYAAEKKDHWVIRRYFDTYFTQGPFFTRGFKKLSEKYGDFEVVETGWTKQDWIKRNIHTFDSDRDALLRKTGRKRIALYAPTFSPKLTSIPDIKPGLEAFLAENPDFLLLVKFHPLTRLESVQDFREWAGTRDNVIFLDKGDNITKVQLMSDIVISDTSSAVYEFLLLDKPVVTLNTIAKEIYWENVTDVKELPAACMRALNDTESIHRRRRLIADYDPHFDGQCCRRMLDAAADYIRRHGVPRRRELNLWRKYRSIKTFGRQP